MNKKSPKKKPPQAGKGTNGAMWIFFFVSCIFMFVIGVLVGRDTMPLRFDMAELNSKLAQLQKSVLAEEKETPGDAKPISAPTPAPMPFDFYEKLRNDQERPPDDEEMPVRLIKPKFEKSQPSSVTVARATPGAEPVRQHHQVREIRETTVAEARSTTVQQPESGESRWQSRRDEPATPGGQAAAGRGYVIQVVSLRDIRNAEAVRDRFKERGYPAYTQRASVEGSGEWHRVRIGPYHNREQAKKDLNRLQSAGVDAIILLNQ